MHGDKKVILHLVFDGILFDRIYTRFEQMTKYENIYLFGIIGGDKDYKYIKKHEKIIHVNTHKEWSEIISNPQIDIIFLHGLWLDYLKAVGYIRDNVMVMWWCYGMEIYENCLHWPSLLPMKIYKPKTHLFWLKTMHGFHRVSAELSYSLPGLYILLLRIVNIIKGIKGDDLRNMLARMDYIFTPLKNEFIKLKDAHPYIKAAPFVLRAPIVKEELEIHDKAGGVLFEHSSTISNNHLDLIKTLRKKKIDFSGRHIYIPLSYGSKILSNRIMQEATFDNGYVHCLLEAMPLDDYNKMISSCSHAFFGMLRQSGLGNIYMCFQKGIKVFFFKDSILYEQFKNDGYYVYSIENDLNNKSIAEPLTPEQAYHNYNLFHTQFDGKAGTYEQQFDKILNNK